MTKNNSERKSNFSKRGGAFTAGDVAEIRFVRYPNRNEVIHVVRKTFLGLHAANRTQIRAKKSRTTTVSSADVYVVRLGTLVARELGEAVHFVGFRVFLSRIPCTNNGRRCKNKMASGEHECVTKPQVVAGGREMGPGNLGVWKNASSRDAVAKRTNYATVSIEGDGEDNTTKEDRVAVSKNSRTTCRTRATQLAVAIPTAILRHNRNTLTRKNP